GRHSKTRHSELEAYFAEQPFSLTGEAATAWNRRKLVELPFQQAESGQRRRLARTLRDARYLQGKLTVGGANAVLEDLDRIRDDEAIERIAWVLRGWGAFLEQYPEEVANQVEGRRLRRSLLHHTPWEQGKPSLRLLHPTLPGDPAQMRVLAGH